MILGVLAVRIVAVLQFNARATGNLPVRRQELCELLLLFPAEQTEQGIGQRDFVKVTQVSGVVTERQQPVIQPLQQALIADIRPLISLSAVVIQILSRQCHAAAYGVGVILPGQIAQSTLHKVITPGLLPVGGRQRRQRLAVQDQLSQTLMAQGFQLAAVVPSNLGALTEQLWGDFL